MKGKNIKVLSTTVCTMLAAVIPAATVLSACGGNSAVLQNISVTSPPSKTEYKVGESFSTEGMVVTAEYDTTGSKVVTNYTYSPAGSLTFDDTSIIISYTEGEITKTATQNITVIADAELESLEITTAPSKVEYSIGERFSRIGMVVTAKYKNNTSRTVTDYVIEPVRALELTDTAVTVSYTENGVTKTAEQPITVRRAALTKLAITKRPDKLTYKLGEKFDSTGMVVTATYANNSTETVDNAFLEVPGGEEGLGVNDTLLKVSYTVDGVTKSATYTAGNTKLLIEAPEVTEDDYTGATELLFSDESNYELVGSAEKTTWQGGEGSNSNIDRLRCNDKSDAEIIFEHDFTNLENKDKAALRVIMSITRGGTVMEISTDEKQTWTTMAEAQEGTITIPADYRFPATTIDGKPALDSPNRNVFYCYYGLNKYLSEETGKVYIRFRYENPAAKGWIGPDSIGSDLMHSIVFYDSLDLAKLTGENELSAITVKTQPKTSYIIGDRVDLTGLVLDAEWADGTHSDVTSGFVCTNTGALTADDTKITVAYTKCIITRTTDISITVSEPASPLASIAITKAPDKVIYREGEIFSSAGMEITATYEDGSTRSVIDFEVEPTGALTSDITEITVTFGDKTAICQITVKQSSLHSEDKVVAEELMFTDESNFTLSGGATVGVARQFADGRTAVRLRANRAADAYIQVQYTFGDENTDLSQAGFMFYGLHSRLGTVIKISVDGENWEYLYKWNGSATRIMPDWKEDANSIIADGDKNMYAMYYDISEYLTGDNKTVYIRFGYEDTGKTDAQMPSGANAEGADIFGSVTFYTKLDLSKVL